MGRAASWWIMFNIVVKADGWWAGGQPLSRPRPPFVNDTSNMTNNTSEDGSSLSFFSFGNLLKGVSPAPSPPSTESAGVPPGAPAPPVDGELSWGWWSVSLLVEWAVGRVFSTRDMPGSASTRGGWAGYLIDRSGLWMFGNFWPVVAWSFLIASVLGALVGLAWSLRTLRQVCCCCCRRPTTGEVGANEAPGPATPRVALTLPSVPVTKGFVKLELAGPEAPRAVDTEFCGGASSAVWWPTSGTHVCGRTKPGRAQPRPSSKAGNGRPGPSQAPPPRPSAWTPPPTPKRPPPPTPKRPPPPVPKDDPPPRKAPPFMPKPKANQGMGASPGPKATATPAPFPSMVKWFCGACGEVNSMRRGRCNVCDLTQSDHRNVFQEATHWICGVCGEENSVRRDCCNSPYCRGVRTEDSALVHSVPSEPGSSSSAGQGAGVSPNHPVPTPPNGQPKFWAPFTSSKARLQAASEHHQRWAP